MCLPMTDMIRPRHSRAAGSTTGKSGVPPTAVLYDLRPRKPKSKAVKKQELRKQRRRLQDAGKRSLAASQSRRPRSRQNRIGNAAARRDARALSRVRHSNAWLW